MRSRTSTLKVRGTLHNHVALVIIPPDFLLSKGYEVHGIMRKASTFNTQRLDHVYVDPHILGARIHLHYNDLFDPGLMTQMMVWAT